MMTVPKKEAIEHRGSTEDFLGKNPTTRCHPRTLEEAFKDDIANAQWFYPPERSRSNLEYAMLSAAFWVWLGLAYWWSNS